MLMMTVFVFIYNNSFLMGTRGSRGTTATRSRIGTTLVIGSAMIGSAMAGGSRPIGARLDTPATFIGSAMIGSATSGSGPTRPIGRWPCRGLSRRDLLGGDGRAAGGSPLLHLFQK